MSDDTTIRVKRSTKKRLDRLHVEKGKSYDDILRRLLDLVEEGG